MIFYVSLIEKVYMALNSYITEMLIDAFSNTESSEFGFIANADRSFGHITPEMILPYWWYYRNHNEKMIEKYGRFSKDVELESPELFLELLVNVFDQFIKFDHPDIENEYLFVRIICENKGELMIFRVPKKNLSDDYYKDGHKFDLPTFKWDGKEVPQELLDIRKENPDKGQYISIQYFLPINCPEHIRELSPKE